MTPSTPLLFGLHLCTLIAAEALLLSVKTAKLAQGTHSCISENLLGGVSVLDSGTRVVRDCDGDGVDVNNLGDGGGGIWIGFVLGWVFLDKYFSSRE